jgi:putative transposase
LRGLRTGEVVDVMRVAVRMVLHELIEAEASEVIGAARYQRTDSRITEREGSRPRTLSAQAGDEQLRVPKLRKGSLFPLILEPRRRIDQALYAVVMEAYVAAVSIRSVDYLPAALLSTPASPNPRSHASALALTTCSPHFRSFGSHVVLYLVHDTTYLHVRNTTAARWIHRGSGRDRDR